jgi:hypothetical protein
LPSFGAWYLILSTFGLPGYSGIDTVPEDIWKLLYKIFFWDLHFLGYYFLSLPHFLWDSTLEYRWTLSMDVIITNFVNLASNLNFTKKGAFENLKHKGDMKLCKPCLTVSQLSRESCGHVVMGYSRYDQGWVADPIP